MEYSTLSRILADRLNTSSQEVDSLCDCLGNVLGETGAELDSVAIPAFGSFEPKRRVERIAVNPASGKRMLYPPKVVMTFRASSLLKTKVRDSSGKGGER
ncbi:MAG: HU family DNA-binding protein [Muribaculaceae bacterium]|nr:HU family DNA-binding protein [Bacteroides sp.]MDE7495470.1 HU family DNA-binding protein [Muribaculaceae bacterium]